VVLSSKSSSVPFEEQTNEFISTGVASL
jgi:hypothetical protein